MSSIVDFTIQFFRQNIQYNRQLEVDHAAVQDYYYQVHADSYLVHATMRWQYLYNDFYH